MEYRITFDNLICHGSCSDKWEYTFSFSVIESSLIGTPKERGSRHKLKLRITEELCEDWQLKGADVGKVAYQGAEDFIKEYITKQIKKGNSLSKELPSIVMSTVNFSEPYNLSNIKYPEQNFFTVNPYKQDQEDGMTARYILSSSLTQQIVAFLVSLPGLDENAAQRAWLYSVGLDPELQQQIQFDRPPRQFFQLLVNTVVRYGRLDDGHLAIVAILMAARDLIGTERQLECDSLIQGIQKELSVQ